ncbi:MAG: type I DNA topoisomerase [Alphaproteobacteria bacterium]|jgi:DNA topoisomerase-1|nr:type I DNA topoisomerase [Alphaproteobacteria bacterium]
MKLVIVESPSKAKTINKYLGKDYKVIASYGHIRQLPSKKGSVDTDNNFTMKWEETTQAKKHLKEITQSVKASDELYLATDPDREGEAISWHIVSYLKEKNLLKNKLVKRVVFNSITKENILAAFKNPRDVDNDLVASYLTRVSLDYLVGFGISPILWRKLPGSRSAGRVQSVALRLICEKENEIEDFKSQEYWSILPTLIDNKKNELQTKLYSLDGKALEKLDIKTEAEANSIKAQIEAEKFSLINIENKKLSKNPFAPFTTSTLQQDAFNKLGFSAKKTMQIAQKLYEGMKVGSETVGLITYMRTDAVQIDPAFITVIRKHIEDEFGSKYLSKSPRIYKTKAKNAQEAHEAIRPTDITKAPSKIKSYLEDDAFKLYELIWKRSIASQMESASYDLVVFDIQSFNKKIMLKATGSILSFDGFYKVYKVESDDDSNRILPNLPLNTELNPLEVITKQHFTEPPARFSEATLVKKLEEMGIGRPSTYANIISVLQDRSYVRIDKKRFIPEPRGRILNVFLTSYFSKYVEYNFTADLEQSLDKISSHEMQWRDVLSNFWVSFDETLKTTEKITIPEVIEVINKAALHQFVGENTKCPKDGGDLQIKNSKFGAFIGCSNYPECTYTQQLEVNKEGENLTVANENNKVLGVDKNQQEIFLKKGPYGYYVEKNVDGKAKRSSLPQSINPQELTLKQADFLLELPLKLDEEISVSIGKFGPYIKKGKDFFSLKGDLFNITLKQANEIIESTIAKKNGIILGVHDKSKKEIALKHGRWGAYIFYDNKNIKIPKEYKNKELTLAQAKEIIAMQKDD